MKDTYTAVVKKSGKQRRAVELIRWTLSRKGLRRQQPMQQGNPASQVEEIRMERFQSRTRSWIFESYAALASLFSVLDEGQCHLCQGRTGMGS